MQKIKQLLSSYTATVILLLLYAVILALATFIEKQYGTVAAKIFVYYSPVFFLLQFLLVLNFVFALIKYRYLKHRRWALLTVHTAFVVILAGAFITHIFGKEGQVHIREGEKTDEMMVHTQRGMSVEKLPFELELTDFRLNRYPGSASPSSYESDVKVHLENEVREAHVYMNNVLDVKGYRFFQASYDEDEMGTILSVNKDVAGRTVTYFGYFLLMAGFVLVFFDKKSRFRKLAEQLKEVRNVSKPVSVILFLLLYSVAISAQSVAGKRMVEAVQQNPVSVEHAAKFGSLPIQSGGRVMPMNTFSSEILRKIHKSNRFGNLNSDQFLLSFLAMPQMWVQVPFIAVSNAQISERYQLPEKYFAYEHLFDTQGNYRLLPELQQVYHKPPAERNATDKDLIKIDEQINILFQLLNYERLAVFPDASHPNHTWYAPGDDLSEFSPEDSTFITEAFSAYLAQVAQSIQSGNWDNPDELLEQIKHFQRTNDAAMLIHPQKLDAELRYNKWNIFNTAKQWYLILGGLLLVLTFMQLMQHRQWRTKFIPVFIIGIVVIFLYQTFGMGLRWYISGYAPWSNSYETMVYVAWATVLAGFIFGRKSYITMALATIFGGVILFVSGLNWMDPQISPLVPVLKSPWLMFHVAVIVAAYGFFGISFLLGATNLSIMAFTKKNDSNLLRIKELSIINSMSLMVGLALMTIGTFLGAIWANESWGRYWGWDPKETWALITVIVYTVVTHLHLVKKWSGQWWFNLLSVLAFSSVLMTFFGVNYFLSGMHSYGQTGGTGKVFVYILLAFAAIGILGAVAYRKERR